MQALRRVMWTNDDVGGRRRRLHCCPIATVSFELLLLSACCADAGQRQQFHPTVVTAATRHRCRSRRTSAPMSLSYPQNHHTVHSHHRGHFPHLSLLISSASALLPDGFRRGSWKGTKMALAKIAWLLAVVKITGIKIFKEKKKGLNAQSCWLLCRDQ